MCITSLNCWIRIFFATAVVVVVVGFSCFTFRWFAEVFVCFAIFYRTLQFSSFCEFFINFFPFSSPTDCCWMQALVRERAFTSLIARLFPADGRARSNKADQKFSLLLARIQNNTPIVRRMNGWMNECKRLSQCTRGKRSISVKFLSLALCSEAVAEAFVCEIEIRLKTDWIFNIYHWMPLFF